MSGKLDELKRKAQEAARKLDEKYDIKTKVDKGTRAATDTIRKGVDTVREETARIDREHRVKERVGDSVRRATEAAEDAVRRAEVKEKASEAAGKTREKAEELFDEAKSKASDMFGEAKKYYESASNAARTGVTVAQLPRSVGNALRSAKGWVKKNPGKTALVSLALVAGARAGSAFTSLDVAVLGAGGAGNWFFHSGIAPYGLRKLAEKYESHLKKQEELLAEGKLSEAEAEGIKFRRNAAKYVGAPLLGAFSVAAGATLVAQAFAGTTVTGIPISLVLGGNPMLSSIWLFGNGLVCFHNGYKFFMMALADREEVARVVNDIKALLPAYEGQEV